MNEIALQFGSQQALSAIVSLPDDKPNNTGVILLNAGLVHRMGPFRLNVNLARKLAAENFIVMRLDSVSYTHLTLPTIYSV